MAILFQDIFWSPRPLNEVGLFSALRHPGALLVVMCKSPRVPRFRIYICHGIDRPSIVQYVMWQYLNTVMRTIERNKKLVSNVTDIVASTHNKSTLLDVTFIQLINFKKVAATQ